VALLAAPARFGRPWLGSPAETPGGSVAVRALGVRDLALGALTVAALTGRGPGSAPVLVAVTAGCDLVDGGALLAARREVPPVGGAVGVFATSAAVLGFALARKLPAS
jgi:hypothetical protein